MGGGDGSVNLINSDLAVLEAGDVRQDLPCTVTPVKPQLGFDFRFHAGYDVTVPLNELAGSEDLLTIVFRVSPSDRPSQFQYFVQRIRVPAIEDEAKGDAHLQGSFDVGEGSYKIDFLMRDRSERVCSSYWDTDANLAQKESPIPLAIPADTVQRSDDQQFKEEPPVQRVTTEPPLNVKVLINFAPQNADSAALRPVDTSALVSILRSISRDPRIGRFSVIAFNMQDERVLYRQEDADRINFPALGDALKAINLGTVDLRRLSEKHSDTQFLTSLIRNEVTGAHNDHPDALIFAGPKVMLDANVPQDALKEIGPLDFPVFYMNYALDPQATPWRDAIGHTVRFFRGTEYTISRPRDLWNAVTEMVSRIVKSRNGRLASAISSQ